MPLLSGTRFRGPAGHGAGLKTGVPFPGATSSTGVRAETGAIPLIGAFPAARLRAAVPV